MLSITEILYNKLALINHKIKFEKLKIISEYKDYLLLQNVLFLYNKNKSIYYYFTEMYYKGYGYEILKYFFSKEPFMSGPVIDYNMSKYINKFINGFNIIFHDNINLYHEIYPIVHHKDINLIESFVHIIFKYKSVDEEFNYLKKLLQYIIDTNDIIFFTKFYEGVNNTYNYRYRYKLILSIWPVILNPFENIIINNTEMYEYCNNLELVSDKNKTIQLTRWYNRKNYIIFLSGYLKNKPDYTNIFTHNDICKYICYYL